MWDKGEGGLWVGKGNHTMIDLAPLLGSLVGIISAGGVVILGLGVAFRLWPLGVSPACPLHSCCSRHCLVDRPPIGSRGYATGVEFVAHLSKAGGFSQKLETIRPLFRSRNQHAALLLLLLLLLGVLACGCRLRSRASRRGGGTPEVLSQ